MPQFARPDADTNNVDAYTDQAGGSTSLFATVDEVSADDADFVRTVVTPSSDVMVFRLSDVTDPVSSTGHIMRMRSNTDVASGGEAIDFTLQLRQGYVSEASLGTLIATLTRTGATGTTWAATSYTLSGAEADAITDYTALFYRLLINKP